MGTPVWQLLAKLDRIHERQIARQGHGSRCRERPGKRRRDEFSLTSTLDERRPTEGQPEPSDEDAPEESWV